VQQSEAEHSERTQRGYAIETETRQNRERLNQIAIEGDRGKARIRTNEERCAELIVRTASAEAELAQAQNRLMALEEERDGHQQVLDSAAADLAAAQQEWSSASRKRRTPPSILRCSNSEQESHRAAILRSRRRSLNLRNQLTQSEERLAGIGREEQRLRAEIATASSQSETFGGQRGQIALEFESVSQRASGLAAEIASLRDLETKRSAESETKKHLDSIRSEYATALGKKGIARSGHRRARLFHRVGAASVSIGRHAGRKHSRRRARRFPRSRTAL
jgi:chromosome segregation ATPase